MIGVSSEVGGDGLDDASGFRHPFTCPAQPFVAKGASSLLLIIGALLATWPLGYVYKLTVELLSRWLGAWPVLLILFQFDFHFQSASRSLRLLPPLPIPYDLSKSSDL